MFEFPDEMDPDDIAWEIDNEIIPGADMDNPDPEAVRANPELFDVDRGSIGAGIASSTRRLGRADEAAGAAIGRSQEDLDYLRAQQPIEAEENKYRASLDDVKNEWNRGDYLQSAGTLFTDVLPQTLGESIPDMGIIMGSTMAGAWAGAKVGAMAAVPIPIPGARIAGAILGAAIGGLPTFFGSNVERQIQENDITDPEQIETLKAASAAAFQGSLEGLIAPVLGFIPGIRGMAGPTINNLVRNGISKLGAKDGIAAASKTALLGGATEAITEVGQQMLERAQAGLEVTDPSALKEYIEAAILGGFLGVGFGGVGGGVRSYMTGKEIQKYQAAREKGFTDYENDIKDAVMDRGQYFDAGTTDPDENGKTYDYEAGEYVKSDMLLPSPEKVRTSSYKYNGEDLDGSIVKKVVDRLATNQRAKDFDGVQNLFELDEGMRLGSTIGGQKQSVVQQEAIHEITKAKEELKEEMLTHADLDAPETRNVRRAVSAYIGDVNNATEIAAMVVRGDAVSTALFGRDTNFQDIQEDIAFSYSALERIGQKVNISPETLNEELAFLHAGRSPATEAAKTTAADVMALAKEKNINTTGRSFDAMVRFVTGSANLKNTTAFQKIRLMRTLSNLETRQGTRPQNMIEVIGEGYRHDQMDSAEKYVLDNGRFNGAAIQRLTGADTKAAVAMRNKMASNGLIREVTDPDKKQPVWRSTIWNYIDAKVGKDGKKIAPKWVDTVAKDLKTDIPPPVETAPFSGFEGAAQTDYNVRQVGEQFIVEAVGVDKIDPSGYEFHEFLYGETSTQSGTAVPTNAGRRVISTHETLLEAEQSAARYTDAPSGTTDINLRGLSFTAKEYAEHQNNIVNQGPRAEGPVREQLLKSLASIPAVAQLKKAGITTKLGNDIRSFLEGKPTRGSQIDEGWYGDTSTGKTILLSIDAAIQGVDQTLSQPRQMGEVIRNLARVLSHEQIHALRDAGIISDTDWGLMRKYAKNHARPMELQKSKPVEGRTYFEEMDLAYRDEANEAAAKENLTGQAYDDFVDDFIAEEAIAESFRDWANDRATVTGRPANIFMKIVKAIMGLGNFLRSNNVRVAEDVFGDIQQDRLGERGAAGETGGPSTSKASYRNMTPAEMQNASRRYAVKVRRPGKKTITRHIMAVSDAHARTLVAQSPQMQRGASEITSVKRDDPTGTDASGTPIIGKYSVRDLDEMDADPDIYHSELMRQIFDLPLNEAPADVWLATLIEPGSVKTKRKLKEPRKKTERRTEYSIAVDTDAGRQYYGQGIRSLEEAFNRLIKLKENHPDQDINIEVDRIEETVFHKEGKKKGEPVYERDPIKTGRMIEKTVLNKKTGETKVVQSPEYEYEDIVVPPTPKLPKTTLAEIQFTGLDDYLAKQGQDMVSKSAIMNELAKSDVKIVETISTAHDMTAGGGYQLHGGENYRELVMSVPEYTKISGVRSPNANDVHELARIMYIAEGLKGISDARQRREIDDRNGDRPETTEEYAERVAMIADPTEKEIAINEGRTRLPVEPLTEAEKESLDRKEALRMERVFAEAEAMRDDRADDELLKEALKSLAVEAPFEQTGEDILNALPFTLTHHSNIPDVFMHVRLQDFTDSQGRKWIVIDEIQSDIHQRGIDDGYYKGIPKIKIYSIGEEAFENMSEEERANYPIQMKDVPFNQDGEIWVAEIDGENASFGPRRAGVTASAYGSLANFHVVGSQARGRGASKGVYPDIPFKSNWVEMATRRVVQLAIDGDYDGVAWTTADVQHDRNGHKELFDVVYDMKIPKETKRLAGKFGGESLTLRDVAFTGPKGEEREVWHVYDNHTGEQYSQVYESEDEAHEASYEMRGYTTEPIATVQRVEDLPADLVSEAREQYIVSIDEDLAARIGYGNDREGLRKLFLKRKSTRMPRGEQYSIDHVAGPRWNREIETAEYREGDTPDTIDAEAVEAAEEAGVLLSIGDTIFGTFESEAEAVEAAEEAGVLLSITEGGVPSETVDEYFADEDEAREYFYENHELVAMESTEEAEHEGESAPLHAITITDKMKAASDKQTSVSKFSIRSWSSKVEPEVYRSATEIIPTMREVIPGHPENTRGVVYLDRTDPYPVILMKGIDINGSGFGLEHMVSKIDQDRFGTKRNMGQMLANMMQFTTERGHQSIKVEPYRDTAGMIIKNQHRARWRNPNDGGTYVLGVEKYKIGKETYAAITTFFPEDSVASTEDLTKYRSGRSSLAPRSVADGVYERLTEREQTLWDRAKKTFRKQLMPGGLLPEIVHALKVARDSMFHGVDVQVMGTLGNLHRAVRKGYGKRWGKLERQQLEDIDAVLHGETIVGMPDVVVVAIDVLRQDIDGLSTEYIRILEDEIQKMVESGDTAAAQRADNLGKVILGNIGEYMTRSYRAFDDPNWFRKIPRDVSDAAFNFLLAQHNGDAVKAEDTMSEIVKGGTAYSSMEGMIKESTLGAKDLSILMTRKKIAPEIRALLGEYKNPEVNYARTMLKMSRLIWNTKFLNGIEKDGVGTFLWKPDDPNKPPDAQETLAGEKTSVLAPLGGYLVTKETKQAFEDALHKGDGGQMWRNIVGINGLVKYGKTILSPTTQIRNFFSAGFFTVANAAFNPKLMKQSFDAMHDYITDKDTGSRGYYKELVELGVLYDTPNAGILMDLLADSQKVFGIMAEDEHLNSEQRAFIFSDKGRLEFVKSRIKNANKIMQKLYRAGDDFWKIIGFENELAVLMEAKGLTRAEASPIAAERIRNTYPTYSMTGALMKKLSKFPLVGTFVSFPSEVIRTNYNIVRLIQSDLKDPDLRSHAKKRMVGMAIAHSWAGAAAAISAGLMGLSDDEEESHRMLGSPWAENASFLYLGRDDNGNLRSIDLSFIDPYNLLHRPFTALFRDQPIPKKAWSAAWDLLNPFFGPDIAFGSIFEVASNTKIRGGRVFNPDASTADQTADITEHLIKSLAPGVVLPAMKVWKAAKGERSATGKVYNMKEELAGFFGLRISSFNPKFSLYFRTFEFTEALGNARSHLTSIASDINPVSEDDLQNGFEQANRIRIKAYSDMMKFINAAKASGVSDSDIRKLLRASGVSKQYSNALARGREAPKWRIGKSFLKGSVKRANLLVDRETSNEIRRRRKFVRDAARILQE